jgi:hypothetical protein
MSRRVVLGSNENQIYDKLYLVLLRNKELGRICLDINDKDNLPINFLNDYLSLTLILLLDTMTNPLKAEVEHKFEIQQPHRRTVEGKKKTFRNAADMLCFHLFFLEISMCILN